MAKNHETEAQGDHQGVPSGFGRAMLLDSLVAAGGIKVMTIHGKVNRQFTDNIQDWVLTEKEISDYGITIGPRGEYVLPNLPPPPKDARID